jgi:enoyl-CoA hydratase/carnithine racemase
VPGVQYDEIRVDDDDHVRLITLDRPARRNAMSWRMLAEVADAMAAADEDDDVRGRPHRNAARVLRCDIRFVAADAKLSFAFTRRGVAPELGSHFLLPRVVGFSNAADLLISGRTFSGTEAAAIGLASRSLPADEVLPAALEYAHDVARECSPTSCAIVKELLWSGLDTHQAEIRRIELALFGWAGPRDDAREGVLAWSERRSPQWTGLPSERPNWWPTPPT